MVSPIPAPNRYNLGSMYLNVSMSSLLGSPAASFSSFVIGDDAEIEAITSFIEILTLFDVAAFCPLVFIGFLLWRYCFICIVVTRNPKT